VSDLWTDAKLTRGSRGDLVVVESAGEIVWVPGFRAAHPFRVTEATTRVARLEVDRLPGRTRAENLVSASRPSPSSARDRAASLVSRPPELSASSPTGSGILTPHPRLSSRILCTEAEIAAAVDRLAAEIASWAAGRPILAVSILQGSFVFAADLLRRLPGDVRIGFVDREGTPITRSLREVSGPILLVEDILDTGLSLARIRERCRTWGDTGPREVRICVMFDKQVPRKAPIEADFSGLVVPDLWVVGYGLDHEGLYRNLPYLTSIEP
jgi:hypoxanthine phosphoribosyltransferase